MPTSSCSPSKPCRSPVHFTGNPTLTLHYSVDYAHPEAQEDVLNWGKWVVKELGLSGFRFDAVQHFSQNFTNRFVAMLEEEFGKDKLFLVGEVWDGDGDRLTGWLETMVHKFSLFDA